MAYWINDTARSSPTRQMQYIMDTDADKSNLPTAAADGVSQGDSVTHLKCGKGSTALSIGSGKIFMLNSSNSWVEIGG